MKRCDVSVKLSAEVLVFWDFLMVPLERDTFNLNHLACKPLKCSQTSQGLVKQEAGGWRIVTFHIRGAG